MSISMVRREEIILNFKDGFAQTELLPGTFALPKAADILPMALRLIILQSCLSIPRILTKISCPFMLPAIWNFCAWFPI